TIPTSSDNLLLGHDQRFWPNHFFSGSISDVRIYNRALTQDEITRLYDNYKPKIVIDSLNKGLVGYWPLDSKSMKSASTTADLTPQGNDGTLYGRALADRLTADRKGAANGAMSFDGSADLINTGIDMIKTGDDSVSAWIYAKSGGVAGRVIDNGRFLFWLRSSTNYIALTSDGGITYITSGVGSIPYNQWVHVVAVRNSTGYGWIYVNGILIGTSGATGTPVAGTSNVVIGNEAAADRSFDGIISDVRIYNRALSADEVKMLYERY
ncbi:MAG: hypothetical protein NT162_01125, partial [Candidatus Woesebacteria bacterium]|nr:hypothetical protein [Candidatus Woesebacteria bacterium]